MSEQDKNNVADDAFETLDEFKKAYLPELYKREQLDKLIQTASQHYEREIAELKAELEIAQGDNVLHRYRSAQLSQEITRLEGLVEQNKAFAENDKAFLDKITQLTAQVNQLREALTSIAVYNGGLQDSFSQIIEDTCNSALKSKK